MASESIARCLRCILPNLQDALFTLRRDDEPDYEPLMHGGAAESLFVTSRVKKSIRRIIQSRRLRAESFA
jgi:hypothetical protein